MEFLLLERRKGRKRMERKTRRLIIIILFLLIFVFAAVATEAVEKPKPVVNLNGSTIQVGEDPYWTNRPVPEGGRVFVLNEEMRVPWMEGRRAIYKNGILPAGTRVVAVPTDDPALWEPIWVAECGNALLEVPLLRVAGATAPAPVAVPTPVPAPTPHLTLAATKEEEIPPFALVFGVAGGMSVSGTTTRDPFGIFLSLGNTPAGAAGGGIAAALGEPGEPSLGFGGGYDLVRSGRMGVTLGGGLNFPLQDLLNRDRESGVGFGIGISLSWGITPPRKDSRRYGWGGGIGYSLSSEEEKFPRSPNVETR